MIFTREEITSEYFNPGEFNKKHFDTIVDLYNKIMMLDLDGKSVGQESHDKYCLMVAICLVTNNDEPSLPLPLDEEDEKYLPEIMGLVDIVMTLHNMENCGTIEKEIKNGEVYYKLAQKKENET